MEFHFFCLQSIRISMRKESIDWVFARLMSVFTLDIFRLNSSHCYYWKILWIWLFAVFQTNSQRRKNFFSHLTSSPVCHMNQIRYLHMCKGFHVLFVFKCCDFLGKTFAGKMHATWVVFCVQMCTLFCNLYIWYSRHGFLLIFRAFACSEFDAVAMCMVENLWKYLVDSRKSMRLF